MTLLPRTHRISLNEVHSGSVSRTGTKTARVGCSGLVALILVPFAIYVIFGLCRLYCGASDRRERKQFFSFDRPKNPLSLRDEAVLAEDRTLLA